MGEVLGSLEGKLSGSRSGVQSRLAGTLCRFEDERMEGLKSLKTTDDEVRWLALAVRHPPGGGD